MPGGEKKSTSKKTSTSKRKATSGVKNKKKPATAKKTEAKKPSKVNLKVRKVEKSKEAVESKIREKVEEKMAPNKKSISQQKVSEQDIKTARIVSQRHEKDKKLLLYLGVSFFMLVITFFWLYHTKLSIEKTRMEWRGNDSGVDWRQMADELGEQMLDLKENLAIIKDFASSSDMISQASSSDIFTAKQISTSTKEMDAESIALLKEDLEKRVGDKAEDTGEFYFEMSKEGRDDFLLKIQDIEVGMDLDQVKEILGEADLAERLVDKRGAFISNLHTYYIQILEKDSYNEEIDEYIVLDYDESNVLQKINTKIVD